MGGRERSMIGGREGREDSWLRDGTSEVERWRREVKLKLKTLR